METYLPYIGGVLLLAALAAWIYMLVKRFKPYRQMVTKTKKLFPYKKDIESRWNSFLLAYRLKMDIAYVPPNPMEEAIKHRDEVLSQLKEVCKSLELRESKTTINVDPHRVVEYYLWEVKFPQVFWKFVYYPVRDFLRAITLPIWLSFPSNRAEKLQKRVSELKKLYEEAKKAISTVESLRKSSKFLTTKENKRHQESFARKLYERDIRSKRDTIAALKRNLRAQIGYIMTRQQEKSLAIGEPSINRGLDILDFDKAKKTWEAEIRRVESLEQDENRLEDAIREYEALTISFQMEQVEGNGQPLTYIERRAFRIKEEIHAYNRLQEDLEELEKAMGIKTQPVQELSQIEALFKEAADHWSSLEWEKLRNDINDVGQLLAAMSGRNSALREWVRFILPLREKVRWLDEAVIPKLELQSLEVEEDIAWQTTKKKLEHNVLNQWAAGNEEKLNDLMAEIKAGIENRQQRLATMAYQKAQEMELDPEVSDKAVKTLKHLHNIIIQGPTDDAATTLVRSMARYEPKVRQTGTMVKTELGTEIPAHMAEAFAGTDAKKVEDQEDEETPRRRKSLLNGLREAEGHYYNKGDSTKQS